MNDYYHNTTNSSGYKNGYDDAWTGKQHGHTCFGPKAEIREYQRGWDDACRARVAGANREAQAEKQRAATVYRNEEKNNITVASAGFSGGESNKGDDVAFIFFAVIFMIWLIIYMISYIMTKITEAVSSFFMYIIDIIVVVSDAILNPF